MENLKVVKVVNKGSTYKGSNGKEYTKVNYYLVFGNTWVAFRPSFAKGYTQIDTFCEVVVNK